MTAIAVLRNQPYGFQNDPTQVENLPMTLSAKLLRRLGRDRSGVAMTEFALALPLLLTVGLCGAETANLTLAHMRSGKWPCTSPTMPRASATPRSLMNRKIYETRHQRSAARRAYPGEGAEFLRQRPCRCQQPRSQDIPAGQQYIRWQRCKGMMNVGSAYGSENNHVTGMGPAGSQVTRPPAGP